METNVEFAKSGFMSLPPWGKVGVLAVVTIGIVYLIRTITKGKNQIVGDVAKEKRVIEDELANDPTKQTWPASQYYAFANKIMAATEVFGTDERAIYNVFYNIHTDKDFLLLKKAFGVREYNGDVLPHFILQNDLNLQGVLSYELNNDEIKKVNAILKKNGVRYKI